MSKKMVTLNPIPLENELPLGAVVQHRTEHWKAVIMSREIKFKKGLIYFLFGQFLGYRPEKITVYWLLSLNGHKQYHMPDLNLKQQFAYRNEVLSSEEILRKMHQHDELYVIKRYSRHPV